MKILALPSNFRLAAYASLLNIVDIVSTLYLLSIGGTEMNPVMDYLLSVHPGLFVGVKLVAISAGLVFLHWGAEKGHKVARYGLGVITLGYLALAFWHAYLLGFVATTL